MQNRFLRLYGLVTFVCLSGIALLNYSVDPEGVFMPSGEYTSAAIFNLEDANPRTATPIIIAKEQPTVAAYGNSRVRFSWNPRHVLIADQAAVNAAVPGALIYEIYNYVRHAHFSGPGLQKAYIGLDLAVFEPRTKSREGFDENVLKTQLATNDQARRPYPRIDQLLNFDTTALTFSYLNRQRKGSIPRLNGFYAEMPGSDGDPRLLRFLLEEVHYRKIYAHFDTAHDVEEQRRWYRELVTFAHAQNMELVTYFNPIHARLGLVMQRADALQHFNDLKRFVVATHREVARHAGQQGFAVWDFANVNSITSERLPLTAADNNMRFFWDASHHNAQVGAMMIRTMETGELQRVDFGVRLDLVDLEAYLQSTADGLQTYWTANPHYHQHIEFVLDNPKLPLEAVRCHPQVRGWLEQGGYDDACRD